MGKHNHITRDIKPLGQCPACDDYHDRHIPKSEGKKQFKPLEIDVVPDEGLWLDICNQPDDIEEQVANGRELEVDEMITFIEKSAYDNWAIKALKELISEMDKKTTENNLQWIAKVTIAKEKAKISLKELGE